MNPVIISSGSSIYKMNYKDVLNYYIETDADITVVYTKIEKDLSNYDVIVFDKNNRLIDFEEKPIEPKNNFISIGIYVISRNFLINILYDIIKDLKYEIVGGIIIRLRKKFKINCYEFKGYWRSIISIKSYYDINMDFLKPEIRNTRIYYIYKTYWFISG